MMADVVDSATRSRMMSGIRGKNTKPELVIRRALHAQGFRFRLHPKEVPGRPDLVLPRYRAAIFINGCFWHGHDCRLFRLPSTRSEFWAEKIATNRLRDRTVAELLDATEWRTLTIWECSLRGRGKIGLNEVISRSADWIKGGSSGEEIGGTQWPLET